MLEVQLRTGIPQGSPLSPILYLFYNADLIDEIANRYRNIALVTGYIDDVCILVWGLSPEVNCWQLERIHHIAERWEKTHASRFSPKKYGLIHMYKTQRGIRTQRGPGTEPLGSLEASIRVRGVTVEPKPALRYLGVWLDNSLTGKEHVEQARAKAATLINAMRSIAGMTWGTTTVYLQCMYTTVLMP